jgi:hypothetical protein
MKTFYSLLLTRPLPTKATPEWGSVYILSGDRKVSNYEKNV